MSKIRNRYNELSITAKASIWFTVCNLILKGISFITVPIFSRMLSSSEYGTLTVYMSFEQIILTLATWETALSAYQKGLFKYREDIKFFTISTLLFSNIVTSIFFAVVWICFPMFNGFTELSPQNTMWLFLYMIVQPAYSCWLIEMRTRYEYKKATLVTIAYSLISVIVPMAAILLISRTADIKFKFTLIGSIAVYLVFYIRRCNFLSLRTKLGIVKEQWRYLILFQVPIVVHALSYTVLAQADRIMIDKMVGPSQAAYYGVAYSIANVVSVFQYSINQALVPWRFEKLEAKKYLDIRKTTQPLLLGVGMIVLIFIFIAPEIIRIMFTSDYYEAIWCMPPITLSVYFMFLYTLFVWVENYYEKTQYVAIVSISCAILNIVLNYSLIGIFGYIVCGYTTLASYIVFCLGHYYYMKKTVTQWNVTEDIYDIKSCVWISMILIVGMIAATLTYSYIIIRYSIVAIVIVVAYIKRDTIKGIIKGFKKGA